MLSNWFHDLVLFIFAVGAHWQALATGGIVTAGVGVYEKKRNTSLSWQSYAAIISAFLLYSVFAAWQDEHHNTSQVVGEKSSISSTLGSCQTDIRVAQGALHDKQSLADTLQKAFVSSQGPQQQQAANVASCITNLAKMNPVIRESISVIPVTYGTESAMGRINDPKGLVVAYISELFVITNEPERNFHGDLKCSKDFTILTGPEIEPMKAVSAVMRTGSLPKMLAPNEYLIVVSATGTEWNQSHPAYLSVRTAEQGFGCTFTPTE